MNLARTGTTQCKTNILVLQIRHKHNRIRLTTVSKLAKNISFPHKNQLMYLIDCSLIDIAF